jgi:hypothetical protein
MKMHYLAILKNDVKPSPELCAEFNDTGLGYFTKGTVKTFVRLTASTTVIDDMHTVHTS